MTKEITSAQIEQLIASLDSQEDVTQATELRKRQFNDSAYSGQSEHRFRAIVNT